MRAGGQGMSAAPEGWMIFMSVCPPAAALDLAAEYVQARAKAPGGNTRHVFVDCNALAPSTRDRVRAGKHPAQAA